jgi:DNA-binding HxlR family transcriptional regulator
MGPVLKRTYEGQVCSIAGALELVGERWTLLIVRDLFLGVRRFDDLQRDLGIARNVLRDRLNRLVEEGIVRRRRYQERPERFEYVLTDKGVDLWPVLHSVMSWGDRYAAPEAGPATVVEHRGCGGRIDDRRVCEACGTPVGPHDVKARPGPGARPGRHPLLSAA